MTQLVEHTERFSQITMRTFAEMFGVDPTADSDPVESHSLQTEKTFLISLYYTGTVYGEYVLALDERTAAKIIGIEDEIDDSNRDEVREEISDAICETLNMIVGEAITDLQQTYAKLTLTAPRVIFGKVKYPQFKTGRKVLQTAAGDIECHFCLDAMRLDLATSYEEAMDSLLEVNESLKQANQHLARQQAQLVHTEKMASVGILASGVAHEINNPLFFVDSNLNTLNDYVDIIDSTLGLYDKLCRSLQDENGHWIQQVDSIRSEREDHDFEFVMEDTKQLMVETREGVARIKNIVQGLKDFSQVDRGGSIQADLNVIVENTLNLTANQLSSDVQIEKNLGELPPIVCNVAEIGQVITGLVLNASQAIEQEGTIQIQSTTEDEYVVVRLKDDGCGIAQEHLEHLFEPFYSTKPEGDGAGLGLSIAYGVVQKHNGSIQFRSELGKGTEVTLRLPLSGQPAPA